MNLYGPERNRPEENIPINTETVEDHIEHLLNQQGNLAFQIIEKIMEEYNRLEVQKMNIQIIFL